MEPNLTFYHGQEITAVEPEGDGWAIVLESGARIVNLDPDYEMPENVIVGMAIAKVTLSASSTVIYAGPSDNPQAVQINLNPTQYGIDDATYAEGLVMPQSSVEERKDAGLPVEAAAPGERVVDGPDAEGVAERAAVDPELVPDEDEVDPL
jgi:hypothetical protein